MVLAGIAVVLTLALAGLALHARRLRGRLVAAEGAAARYEALAAHLPDVSVLLYDHDLRFTLLDGAAMQTHGWRREDLEGRLIAEVIPPAAPRRAARALQRRAARRVDPRMTGSACATPPGATATSTCRLRDARGAVVGGMMVVRDVTESEALRSAVEARQAFLSGMLDAADRSHRRRATPRAGWSSSTRRCSARSIPTWGRWTGRSTSSCAAPTAARRSTPADVPLFRALQGDVISDVELTIALPGHPDAAAARLGAADRRRRRAHDRRARHGHRRHRPARDREPPAGERGALPLGRRERRATSSSRPI